MFNTNRKSIFAVAFALALLCTAAVKGVDAQSNEPIADDELVACVQVDDELWIAPLSLRQELEAYLQVRADVQLMGVVREHLPPAGSGLVLHFEGAEPGQVLSLELDALGYRCSTYVQPVLPSAPVAVLRTD